MGYIVLAVDISALEKRIDELIALCDELERKHASLESDRENWMQERTRLLKRTKWQKPRLKP